MRLSRTIVLQHHERYDGKGYPSGQAGDEISHESRIVAVVSVYDVLTSKQSYKTAFIEKVSVWRNLQLFLTFFTFHFFACAIYRIYRLSFEANANRI